MPKQRNPSAVQKQLEAILRGLEHHLPVNMKVLSMNGKERTPAELLALFRSYLERYKAPEESYRAWKESLRLRREVQPKVARDIQYFALAMSTKLGERSQKLRKFGLKPRKDPRPLTGPQNVLKAQRAAATRAERHTLGKRQKARIKGTVAPEPPAAPSR